VVFPFSPVFCALGSSTMDMMHVYELSKRMVLMEPGTKRLTNDYESFNRTVESLCDQARKDLAGEGLDLNSVGFTLELDMLYGGQFHVKRALSPRLIIRNDDDVKAICDAFAVEFSETFSPFVVNPEGGVFVDSFIVKAIVPTKKFTLPTFPLGGKDPGAAQKGERPVYWQENNDYQPTKVYAYDRLSPGHIVAGPAIVEGEYTTMVVPPLMKFSIDEHGLGILE
jgi:N-methylhydantoinase A/acetophenone carboxylase